MTLKFNKSKGKTYKLIYTDKFGEWLIIETYNKRIINRIYRNLESIHHQITLV